VGPNRAQGAFEAQARLTIRPTGILFRGLRTDEIITAYDDKPKVRGGTLRPWQRHTPISVAECVGRGSRQHTSRYIHRSTDIVAATCFARNGGQMIVLRALGRGGRPERVTGQTLSLQHHSSP